MKIICFLLLSFFVGYESNSQPQDSLKIPASLLSLKAQKMELAYLGLSRYDYDIGRYLGKFSAIGNDGKLITDSVLHGKVTFVHFWFDGCSPCHAVFSPLNALYTKYKTDSNFQVLSFTFDRKDLLQSNVKKYNLLYRTVSVPEKICRQLMGAHGFSCSYILDQDGRIVSGHSGVPTEGNDPYSKSFIPAIDSLLQKRWANKQ